MAGQNPGCSLPIPGLERVLGIMCIIRTVFSHSPFYLRGTQGHPDEVTNPKTHCKAPYFHAVLSVPVTEWKPSDSSLHGVGGWRREEGQAEVTVPVRPPNLFSLMVTGACLHFVHVFMLGFQWWKNHQAGEAWSCHPLGSMALEQSLLLSTVLDFL